MMNDPTPPADDSVTDTASAQIPIDSAPDPRIAELQAELASTKDQMLRALAEAENLRRRAERSAEEARLFAIDRFGKDLLQVADMLSRAVTSAPESADERVATFVDGVRLTETALLEAFGRHGLKRIANKGVKFDPNLHQAVSQIPSDEPAGHVAEVLQAGFTLNDRVLRAAMVIVSGGGGTASAPPASGSGETGESVDIKV